MREGVRPKTEFYVICVMLCYVMLCYVLGDQDHGEVGVSDHEQLNDDLRNRSKVWTVQS